MKNQQRIEMKSESLTRGLWYAVLLICLIFFAFAAGVWTAEQEDKPEETPAVSLDRVGEPMMEERTAAEVTVETAPEVSPMLCEDTYLREDIPLSFSEQAMLYGACLEFEVPYPLALAVIEQETGYRNVSGDGGRAYGFFQIWPMWWSELMEDIGAEDLNDAEDNFRAGCAILGQLLEQYGTEDALTVYNSGKPGSSSYSQEVIERMEDYDGL